jgi:hypothetical protein
VALAHSWSGKRTFLAPEIEEFSFETSFDRIFFLHHADELVVELSTQGLRAGGA